MIWAPVLLVVALAILLRRGAGQIRGDHRVTLPALCGAAIAAVTGVGYLLIIERQGPPYDVPRVSLVAVLIFAAALAACIGSVTQSPWVRRRLLIGGSVGLWMLGLVGLFSVGLPLLLAGAMTFMGAARSPQAA